MSSLELLMALAKSIKLLLAKLVSLLKVLKILSKRSMSRLELLLRSIKFLGQG
jgi:hypothetical protein